ncbi:MAG: hypothetical protein ACTHW2_00445 [Tissierella sp.]|uniref:hypothetical protein n=1 Tax=Tissierella sp. TaxID=41274 RepID=UPI003F9BF861
MNWLRKFMYGRYGVDQLSMTLIVISLLLSLFAPLLKLPPIIFLIILVIAYVRVFSKNTRKRYMENQKFLEIFKPVTSRFNKLKKRIKGRKKFKYFRCKRCKQEIKVPKGKGKIRVTCPNCGEKIIKKT